MSDLINRQAAIDALTRKMVSIPTAGEKDLMGDVNRIRAEDISVIRRLPSAQPEQRYTEEELRVFRHGISLSLLSKQSSQHWQYDEDTATEIKFLERLYEKVSADMRGEAEGRKENR